MSRTKAAWMAAVTLALAQFAAAQSDLPVSTVRKKDAPAAPQIDTSLVGELQVSSIPRYYLDTIDNLNRVTTDATRPAPGLVKNNYVGKVYGVYNTPAIEIQTYLLRILAFEGGVSEVMGATTVTDGEGRPVQHLFVAAPDFMIPGLDQIVAACDRPNFKFNDSTSGDFGHGPGCVRYVGKHRTASELVSILRGTELGNVGNFLFPPFADDSTNSIYIIDNPTDIGDDLVALELFDRPPLQAEIDCVVYEIDDDDAGTVGLDLDFWKRSLSGAFTVDASSGSGAEDGSVYRALLALDARSLADFLNYTTSKGHSKVVTAARVTMVNSEDNPGSVSGGGARGTATGESAVIESLVPISFTVRQDDVGPTNASNARNEVVSTFEGVRVTILPFIATESLTVRVEAQVNSVVGISPATGTPLVAERRANTMVNLVDQIPLVLGGLEKTTTQDVRVGIPLLKEIPLLQYLVSVERTRASTSKVYVVVTPRLKDATVPETVPEGVPWTR